MGVDNCLIPDLSGIASSISPVQMMFAFDIFLIKALSNLSCFLIFLIDF